MKKCLLLLPRDIFPINCGYSLKNKALIMSLSQQYKLSILLITNKPLSEEAKSFYENYSNDFLLYKFPKWRFLANAMRALFTSMPIQVGYYYFSNIQKKINETAPQYDVVIGALIRTYQYIFKVPTDSVKVFDMVDSIGLNYQHSRKNVSSFFWKFIYNIETPRLLNYERKFINNSDVTYLFNPYEVDYWQTYGNVRWLPHGVNTELFSYNKTDERFKEHVAFIGKMDYRPNIDAVEWYIKNIHVNLKHRMPLIIIGANPVDSIKNLPNTYDDIVVTGYVDDPYVFLKSSKVVIAPMQTGGGIQNKVLETMALGKVVIMSTLAAEPIKGGEANTHYLVANTLQEYESAFEKLKDQAACEMIMDNAKRLIFNTYTWDNYSQNYINGIESIIK